MKPSFWHRLDLWARRLTPVGLTLLLVVINIIPFHVPGFARVVPLFALIAVHHWAIYEPQLMPAYAVFVVGVLQDMLSGVPLGLNTLVFLVVYGAVVWQRRFFVGKSFFITWLGFAVVGAAAMALSWALMSAFHLALVDPRALAYQYLLTIGFFPLVAWGFLRWQQIILKAD
ncbi:MAG: rod shape-determining protein MreD [Rhodospirillales bacterium]|jgi:rod shape-determining protein MreD|nr:rod shape-determining protein MreD [Rhodospirillales bacterium]